jgi:MFS family permease
VTRLFSPSPNWPIAPERSPIYYGWILLLVAVVGVLMSVPGQTAGVSVFTDSLLKATSTTRVELANTYLVGTLMSGLALPMAGRALDRIGARLMATLAALGLGAVLVGFSVIEELAGSGGIRALVVLTVGFVALRFTGQGLLTLSCRVMVAKWFGKRRGLASGLMSVFVSLGFSVAPITLAFVMDNAGSWQRAYLLMALAVGAGMSSVAFLLFRDDPESCGLRLDGAPVDSVASEEPTFGLDEAITTGAFWAIALSLAIMSAVVTGITFHIVDLGSEFGFNRNQSLALFPPIAVVAMIAGPVAGIIADRVRLRWLLLTLLVSQSLSYLGFAYLDRLEAMALIATGVATGLFGTLSTLAMARVFGRLHIGSIASAQMSALVIGSALGPSMLAGSRQWFGSYTPALALAAALPVAVAVLATVARDPSSDGRF